MSPKKETKKSAPSTVASDTNRKGFTDEEKAAMKDRVKELRAAARRGSGSDKAEGESEVLEKIAEMAEPDRTMAKRVHEIILAAAPELTPRTWYGMPAYSKDDKVLCFFQSGQKFKTRYASLGFSDKANFDDGAIWPVVFALNELTPAAETRIADLVKKAVSG